MGSTSESSGGEVEVAPEQSPEQSEAPGTSEADTLPEDNQLEEAAENAAKKE